MEFKKIELKDRDLFLRYLGDYKFYTYEYSFTTLYLWRKYLKIEFAENEDYLVVRKHHSVFGRYFMEPIGYRDENLKSIVEELNCIKREENMNYLFRNVEKPFLDKLISLFGDRVEYVEDVDNFDYIYNTKDLIDLPGSKYMKRRNKFNSFVKKQEKCYFKSIDNKEVEKECENLAKMWYEERIEKTEEMYYELEGISDLLNNKEYLGIKCMAAFNGDGLVGFAIGEKINDRMSVVHIEKCDREIVGAYAYINRIFAKEFLNEAQFIDKEEDLGLKGLREAKMEYRPVKLEKKYIVNIKQ
ncbi:DUF2156 domain-containing protein [uncultured Clostridium sp.]|uniref:DUF2156 domain-containing protein n=1 Tax=uncultured Clostridium sp. TaxID=59620 RepID=UPI0025F21918|nr:phosphatidylglycerol lysyltransferase domain-containing protein [uncultured Clostridium sp.]